MINKFLFNLFNLIVFCSIYSFYNNFVLNVEILLFFIFIFIVFNIFYYLHNILSILLISKKNDLFREYYNKLLDFFFFL